MLINPPRIAEIWFNWLEFKLGAPSYALNIIGFYSVLVIKH